MGDEDLNRRSRLTVLQKLWAGIIFGMPGASKFNIWFTSYFCFSYYSTLLHKGFYYNKFVSSGTDPNSCWPHFAYDHSNNVRLFLKRRKQAKRIRAKFQASLRHRILQPRDQRHGEKVPLANGNADQRAISRHSKFWATSITNPYVSFVFRTLGIYLL